MEKSILEMARGAVTERVDYEMGRVLENIQDPEHRQVLASGSAEGLPRRDGNAVKVKRPC